MICLDEQLHDKEFNIVLKIQNMMSIKQFLLRWFTNF